MSWTSVFSTAPPSLQAPADGFPGIPSIAPRSLPSIAWRIRSVCKYTTLAILRQYSLGNAIRTWASGRWPFCFVTKKLGRHAALSPLFHRVIW
jgi:hypothetical protein